jgi:hypothetical protein
VRKTKNPTKEVIIQNDVGEMSNAEDVEISNIEGQLYRIEPIENNIIPD